MTATLEKSTSFWTSCPPRFATRRRPERETFGSELASVANMLGQPLMPWQRYVADVGGEIDPDTGLPAYREIIVTVPRQSGKTTLYLAWQINRCLSRRWRHPQRCAFTAQTGKDARDKWIDELYPLIRGSQLLPLIARRGEELEINRGMGNESIRFKTGSLIRLVSTGTSSGHSKSLHQAVMDEIWADIDDRREQSLRPAMITVADAQLLVCSTAGTEASVILNRKVDIGRAAVLADAGHGVAFFEWSAPDGWNPEDEDSYFTFMPALCPNPPCRCAPPGENWRHTITSLDALRGERTAMRDNNYSEYRRAYGNRKVVSTEARWTVFTQADWIDAEDATTQAQPGLCLALHASPESTYGAVCAAWRGARDVEYQGQRVSLVHAAVFDHKPGVRWMVGRAVELAAKWQAKRVAYDPAGPTGPMGPELAEALKPLGVELVAMKARDVCLAYGMFRNGIATEPDPELEPIPDAPVVQPWRLRVRPDTALTSAAELATTRYIGTNKAWEWKTLHDQSTLLGCTNAVWTLITSPEDEPAPMSWVMYG